MKRGVLTPRIKGKKKERKGGETRKWVARRVQIAREARPPG